MDQLLTQAIKKVSDLVSKKAGIVLGEKQYSMVENRLRSRMIRLGIDKIELYLKYLEAHEESESQALLSLLTTHHTYFFREFGHFEFLRDTGIDILLEQAKKNNEKKLRIWSAACSRGQEVYSLAMFFKFHLSKKAPNMDFEIWGTDVDPESVEIAKKGSYPKEELKSAPNLYTEGVWSNDHSAEGNLKISHEIKKHTHFAVANLMDLTQFVDKKTFDVIFCRNVFIYFEPHQITSISNVLVSHLTHNGFFFVGVSESISNLKLPVRVWGPSIYGHKNAVTNSADKQEEALIEKRAAAAQFLAKNKIYKVLVVDDSKTIHALMRKIFVKDQGFEIIGDVYNGKEALEFLRSHPDVDAVTLDLHMPEMDGVSFLKEYKERKIPILVVSAIDRDDDSGPGKQALSLGAFDYVEKPTVENIEQTGNEIRAKIKTGFANCVDLAAKAKPAAARPAAARPALKLQTPVKSSLAGGQVKPSPTPLNRATLSVKSAVGLSALQKKPVAATAATATSSTHGVAKSSLSTTLPKKPLLATSQMRGAMVTPKAKSSTVISNRPSVLPSLGLKAKSNATSSIKSSPTSAAVINSANKAANIVSSQVTSGIANKPLIKAAGSIINRPPIASTANKFASNSLNKISAQVKSANTLKPIGGAVKASSLSVASNELKKPNTFLGSLPVKSVSDKKKVLIVDDSQTIRAILKKIISSSRQLEVVAECEDPLEVEKLIQTYKPQLITLDIHMPHMDGVTLLKKIFPKYKIPTVMISSLSIEEGSDVLEALANGAVDYIQKPTMDELAHIAPQIVERLETAAIAKVVRAPAIIKKAMQLNPANKNALVLIGSSTGGTEALRVVLESLPANIPPMVVVQHIPPVFSKALADRLNSLCSFLVKEAADGDLVVPNQVLIAPGNKQLGIEKKNNQLIIKISDAPAVNRHRPSVDFMFNTAISLIRDYRMVATILTGMGADGAREMKALHDLGVQTIAQDEQTSVVYGMPRVAKELGGVDFVLPIQEIGSKILLLSSQSQNDKKSA